MGRLEEIKLRKKEIREELKNKSTSDLDEIETELRKLDKEQGLLEIENGESRSLGTVENIINGSPTKEKEKNCELRKGEKLVDRKNINAEQRNLSLGKYIRGAITGKWDGAEDEKRAMTTTATGVIIPELLAFEIIDLARDKSLFTLAEVPVIPMTEGNMVISKIKQDPVFKFKEEGKETSESSMELESVKLETKMCYGYTYVSIEAIKKSRNLEEIIRNAFAESLAQAIDKGMLYGQYSGETLDSYSPSGIINDENINIITAKASEGYDSFIKAIGAVRKNNGEASVCGLNSDTEEMLSLIKTTDGQYITPPQAYTDIKKITTNQLNYDAVNGSDALVFDPNAMIIGLQEDLSFEMFTNSDECIKKGLVGFRIYQMIDCVTTQPKRITRIKNIK